VASPKIASDLLNAEAVGQKALETFVMKCLVSGEVDFHATMSRPNLENFEVKQKTTGLYFYVHVTVLVILLYIALTVMLHDY
jgi:hypothetical protein